MVLDLLSRAEVHQRAVDDFGVYACAKIDTLTRQPDQLVFDGSSGPIERGSSITPKLMRSLPDASFLLPHPKYCIRLLVVSDVTQQIIGVRSVRLPLRTVSERSSGVIVS
jgi:hypothetical protein